MTFLLVLWLLIAVALVVFAIGNSRHEGTLTLSYFLTLSLIHVPGVLVYLSTKVLWGGDADATRIGFQATLIGMAAFVGGAFLARSLAGAPVAMDRQSRETFLRNIQPVAWRCISLGTLAYAILLPVSDFIPSLSSLISPLAALLVVGILLRLFVAIEQNNSSHRWEVLVLLPLLPLTSLVSAGFMGHGVSWALTVVSFLFIFSRRRSVFYFAAPIVVFLGLSIFVTYMGQRTEIRRVVWNSQTSLLQRIGRVSTIVTDFHFLDLESFKDRQALDARLNQNYLVGLGIRNHQNGMVDLFYGDTVPWWALIPRVLWPDKPSVGGGGRLVAAFTRLDFDQSTSIGVGQVLEFYMNFAYVGVAMGFMALGYFLMRIDQGIMRALSRGDLKKVLKCVLPGLALLQPGSNLIEILVGLVAAYVSAILINHTQVLGTVSAASVIRSNTQVRLREAAASRRK